jgi:two-component system nitrogen regulation response regulator GlnG
VRVIAATHQNLEDRVKQGLFREDLFHRLNVIRLRLPALRERREDIAILTRHFLGQSARELGVDMKRLTDEAMRQLTGFDFPGNVRQLENLCHWITVMAPGQLVGPADLPPELKQMPDVDALGDWASQLASEADRRLRAGERGFIDVLTRQFERTLILRALAATSGRRIEAAERLGLGRNTLTRKIQELDLEKEIAGE